MIIGEATSSFEVMFKNATNEMGCLIQLDGMASSDVSFRCVDRELSKLVPVSPDFLRDENFSIRTTIGAALKEHRFLLENKILILPENDLLLTESVSDVLPGAHLIIAVEPDKPEQMISRIKKNIPKNLTAQILPIPALASGITPANSALISTGFYGGGDYALILKSTKRVLLFYDKIFMGEKLFLSPLPYSIRSRPEGWDCIAVQDYFTNDISLHDTSDITRVVI